MQKYGPPTLISSLQNAARGMSGILFISSRNEQERISYAELYRRAVRLLADMQRGGAAPGDEVVLQVRNDRDFLIAFWACLLGGLVAVPLSPATTGEQKRKVLTVWKCLNNPLLLSDRRASSDTILEFFAQESTEGDQGVVGRIGERLLVLDEIPSYTATDADRLPEGRVVDRVPEDIALIQFSSGSTGDPKGVVVTHGGAVVNTADMISRLEVSPRDRYLSWMPLTHDFGIIGMHLTPLVAGIEQIQIPTQLFVRSPMIWFHAINDHRASITASPNFGYRHFLKFFNPDSAAEWDLSSLRIVQNGAEPISPVLCNEFLDVLAPYGLVRTAMLPGYGLAEATLAVSYALSDEVVPTIHLDRNAVGPGDRATPVEPDSGDGVAFVDVGFPVPSMEVRITDGDGNVLGDWEIGTIEIRGRSVTPGYYNSPEVTARTISTDGWLNTGDLGFIREGRIVITGRAKDIIFSGGINYYPHDLERLALELEGVDVNKIAVTGLQNGTPEQIAAFVYFKRPLEEFPDLASRLRSHILRAVGLSLDFVIPVTSIPKTTSGKVQRYVLARKFLAGEYDHEMARLAELTSRAEREAAEELLERLNHLSSDPVRRELTAIAEEIVGEVIADDRRPFVDFGFDSVRGVEFRNRIATRFAIDLPVSLIFDFPDMESLTDAVVRMLQNGSGNDRRIDVERTDQVRARESGRRGDSGADRASRDIAVIGIGCRLPGNVNSLDDLVTLLEGRVDATTIAPSWRWGEPEGNGEERRGAFRDDVDRFDNTMFGITPNEAAWLDPQHRFLLETAWDAIEDGSVRPERLRSAATGVYIGISSNEYARRWEGGGVDLSHFSLTGTMTSTAAGRISYTLGLSGPCLALDTACSSSLAALHLAVAGLRTGECEFALAGGVSLVLDDAGFRGLEQTGALSSDGRCRTFSESADGYGRGEGCGIVLLRRLEDAVRDGDPVYGVIRGSAMNHDGRSNGLTAPNGQAQEGVIRKALEDAACDPDDLGYIETHGTGTSLGDPQEVHALERLFATPSRRRPLVLGAIKSNVGHLESAAGMAGLLRAIVSIRRGTFFPQINAFPANPHIPWERLPFVIPNESTSWSPDPGDEVRPRVAGVSAFGMSGTNVHVVISEYVPESATPAANLPDESGEERFPVDFPLVLPYSAAHPDALVSKREQYLSLLDEYSDRLHPLAAAAAHGRADLEFRGALVVGTAGEQVRRFESGGERSRTRTDSGNLAMLFTGQGSQSFGMGGGLYHSVEDYRSTLEQISSLFEPFLGHPLIDLLGRAEASQNGFDIDRTGLAQPAIFALEYALASWLMSLGITPMVVGGHSVGEFAAAVLAGILSLEDAVRLVAARARFMQEEKEPGGMVSIPAPLERVREVVDAMPNGSTLCVAAVNGPRSVVVSGSLNDLDRLVERLRIAGIDVRRLTVSHAFHSQLMQGVADRFGEVASQVTFNPSRLPFASSREGKILPVGTVLDASYWSSQIVEPVLFHDLVQDLERSDVATVLEVGPRAVLCGLGESGTDESGIRWIPTLRNGSDDPASIAAAIASLYAYGYPVDWTRIYPVASRSDVHLPRYPWIYRRFWIDYPERGTAPAQSRNDVGNPGRNGAAGEYSMNQTVPEVDLRDAGSYERTVDELRKMIADETGYDAGEIPIDRDLFEIGIDSLVLMQVRQGISIRFGVQLSGSVFYDRASISSIATLVSTELDAREVTLRPDREGPSVEPGLGETIRSTSTERSGSAAEGELERVISRQLELMAEQLELLRSARGGASGGRERNTERVENSSVATPPEPAAFVPYRAIDTSSRPEGIVPDDRDRYLGELIERYSRRTGGSKEATERYRSTFANNRNVAGFRPAWKELIYQLQVDHAAGSRVRDIDGNEYIDLTMGFGVNLFGHNPEFIRRALAERLEVGISVGPMSPLAGPIAERLAHLTGIERAAFYNSGSEAVMVALRLARGATGRQKVVIFSGSYHGTFDGILALPGDSDATVGAVPLAPGTTDGMVRDVIVLPYGTDRSLEYIRTHANELAAVLVEPVQSRRPDFQPTTFLRELRTITSESGTALIFDEVITGFRIHPGGAQHHFGVRADIAVFGKVVGGGMPIGIVAGTRRFLDLVDGGQWKFGDASVPPSRNTFVAGTFCHHPMAMAATAATLERMSEEGESICRELNEKTARFAESLNRYFESRDLGIRIVHFGSLFRFVLGGEWELFYFALMMQGVYVWEGRNCFFSTAHTDEDIDLVRRAVIAVVDEMAAAGFAPGSKPAIPAAPTRLPMSSVQRRIFTLSSNPGGELAYHIQGVLRFRSGFDPQNCERALQRIVDRHEGLRTGFIVEDGEFLQQIEDSVDIRLEDETPGDGSAAVDVISNQIRPFDLARPPLLRAVSRTESDGSTTLLLDLHHIAGDGTTLELIAREFLREYGDGARHGAIGSGDVLASPPVQYREFADWETDFVRSEEFLRQQEFWEGILSRPSERLSLPTDFPATPEQTYRGGQVAREFDLAGVRDLARRSRTSVYMVMLALYSEFLRRMASERSFRFGIVHAGRTDGRFAGTVGMFANSLLFPVAVDPDRPFTQLLQSVKEQALELFDNVDYPFERIAKLDPDAVRDQRISLSFEEISFSDSAIAEYLPLPDLQIGTSTGDLNLHVVVCESRLYLQLQYSSDLFGRETAERMLGFLGRLLDEVVADPERQPADFSIVDEEEMSTLLSNEVPGPAVESLADFIPLFEEQVASRPDAPAVYFDRTPACDVDPGVLTYGELDERSNRLARHLRREFGTGDRSIDDPGETPIVAILLERSPEFLVAILGILKAGGGFLAIEPTLPESRIDFMLDDADVNVVVSTGRVLERTQIEFGNRDVVEIERVPAADGIDESGPDLYDPRNNPDAVAYMVYTSGSTGEPKGVMVSRRNLANYAWWTTRDRVEHVGLDVFSLHISPAFDMMMSQIFPPLASGRAIWVHHPELPIDMVMRRSFSDETPINSVSLTPSHLTLLEDFEISKSNVRLVSIGGEVLGSHHRDLLRRIDPDIQLYNDYGPTEATVSCIAHLVNTDGRVNVIGRPMPNSIAYILDDSLRPCPIGIIGEICIGGAVVAMGYRNRPELNAERFLDDPFRPGGRIYRTGDIGRLLPDGTIEFFGRRDRQIKLHGHRIEIGEIEEVILSLPGVRMTAVRLVSDDNGEFLAAWVVGSGWDDGEAIRTVLQDRLPVWMIPSVIMSVDSIPLSRSGKVDADRLQVPTRSVASEGDSVDRHWSPESPAERDLVSVWENLLEVPVTSPDLNFYHAGGDSIRAIRIASRLRSRGYEIDGGTILRLARLDRIASFLEQNRVTGGDVVENVTGNQGPVHLTPIQHWFFGQDIPDPNHWNQGVLLALDEIVPTSVVQEGLALLVAQHSALRTSFAGVPTALPSVRPVPESTDEALLHDLVVVECHVPTDSVTGRRVDGSSLGSWLGEEITRAHRRIDIAAGPLVSGLVIRGDGERFGGTDRLPAGRTMVALCIHHLVVDAVSWSILLEEFVQICDALLSHTAPKLPPVTATVGMFAASLLERATSNDVISEIPYWVSVQKEEAASGTPPVDATVKRRSEGGIRTTRMTFDRERTATIRFESLEPFGLRIEELLTSILALALREWTGTTTNVIAVEWHGRKEFPGLRLDRTVGWFTTICPVLLDASGDTADVIVAIKESIRGVPQNGFGYSLLTTLTPRERIGDLRCDFVPPVLFNYLGDLGLDELPGSSRLGRVSSASVQPGEWIDRQAVRESMVAIDASIREGELTWSIEWHREEFRSETIARLCELLEEAADRVVSCCSQTTRRLTPADFEYHGFRTVGELDEFFRNNRIDPAAVETIRPLVPMQEGMFFEYLRNGGAYASRAQLDITLRGSLDGPLMEKAWRSMVERHDMLRTGFTMEGWSEPVAIVYRSVEPEIHLIHNGIDPAESVTEAENLLQADWERGFDLRSGHPIRLHIVTISSGHHRLVFTTDHIVQDGWCIGLVLSGLFETYDRLRRGESAEPSLPTPSWLSFVEWLGSYDREGGLEFWRAYLDRFERPTSIPVGVRADRTALPEGPDPVDSGRDLHQHTLEFTEEEIGLLVSTARELETTTNVLLRTAWSIVLAACSAQEDILFGAVVSGRPPEIDRVDEIVGLFINTIPVRIRINRGDRVADLVHTIAENDLACGRWHHNSLSDIHRLTPLRERLFDHILVVENYPLDRGLREGLADREDFRLESFRFRGDESFDLVITAMLEISREIRFTFNANRYDSATVMRVGEYLKRLLIRICDQPESPVTQLIDLWTEGSSTEVKKRRRAGSLKDTRAGKIRL